MPDGPSLELILKFNSQNNPLIEYKNYQKNQLEEQIFLNELIARAHFLKNIFNKQSELNQIFQEQQRNMPNKESYMDWIRKCWIKYSKKEAEMIEQLENFREKIKEEDLEKYKNLLKNQIVEIAQQILDIKNEKITLKEKVELGQIKQGELVDRISANDQKITALNADLYSIKERCLFDCVLSIAETNGSDPAKTKEVSEGIDKILKDRMKIPPILFSQKSNATDLHDLLRKVGGRSDQLEALEKNIREKMNEDLRRYAEINGKIQGFEADNVSLKAELSNIKASTEEATLEIELLDQAEALLESDKKSLENLLEKVDKKMDASLRSP